MRRRSILPCKTFQYELSHQLNLIQIGNLIDDLYGVHVHLLVWQRRYYRLFGKYASLSRISETYYQVEANNKTAPVMRQGRTSE